MGSFVSTIIVVPCYNEAERLNRLAFTRFSRQQEKVRLLLVNDGSRDQTAQLLTELAEGSQGRIQTLQLTCNSGKAEAVRQGVLQALTMSPQYVGYWDADLATPLEDIPSFVNVLERRPKTEIVVGCRLPLLGHEIHRQPVRRLLGRCFATAASWALGLPIYDTQCGAKLFRVNAETPLLFAESFATRWIFDVELIARLVSLRQSRTQVGTALYEYPLDRWEDVPGSKLRPRHFVQAIAELAAIYTRYLQPFAPRYAPALQPAPQPTLVPSEQPSERRAA
jgi:glycosyltransferase involved in cell wall biosynthesis